MINKKVCIVQLTRVGDILQTYQAARQFKYENPSFSLSLIARRDMAKGLIFLLKDVFDDIFLFETSDFFPIGTKTLTSAKESLNTFINEVNEISFDLLLNFSFTSSSSYLCNLITAKNKMGIRRNFKNELVVTDKWSQYVYSNVLDSEFCPYNLVDIYKNMLGALDNHSFKYDKDIKNRISIHPFASSESKRFDNSTWSSIIYKILKINPSFEVDILGAKNDLDSVNEILGNEILKNFKHKIKTHVGSSSIEESFVIVKNSKLFIGHDSMVSHLASIAEKESLILTMGSVKPFETSPYNNKVVNIDFSRSTNSPIETISQISHAILTGVKIDKTYAKSSLNIFTIKNLSIYNSHFDESGLRLENILEEACDPKEILKKFLRICFSYYLKNQELEMSIPTLTQESITTFKMLKSGMEYMSELYHHAMITCNQILDEHNKKKPDSKLIQDSISKLAEIDKLFEVTISKFKLLKPINDFFYINRLNSQGEDIEQIIQSNLISYYEAQNFMAFVEDLTNTTLGPKIIDRTTTKDV